MKRLVTAIFALLETISMLYGQAPALVEVPMAMRLGTESSEFRPETITLLLRESSPRYR